MNALAQHWEKIVFVVVLLLVAGLVGATLMASGPDMATMARPQPAELGGETNYAAQFSATLARARAKAPTTLPRRVFSHDWLQYSTASKKLMPKWGRTDPETGARVTYKADADGDGMKNEWELKYGLDWTSADDADADADGDGLTNLQEFQKETDPTDAADPNVIEDEYRLVKVYRPLRPLVFKTKAGPTYQVAYKGATKFVKEGDTINDGDTPLYSVGSYTKKMTNVWVEAINASRQEDRSELTMTNLETGDTFTLVRGQESRLDFPEAEMISRDGGEKKIVRGGDTLPVSAVDADATVAELDDKAGTCTFTVGDLSYTVQAEE